MDLDTSMVGVWLLVFAKRRLRYSRTRPRIGTTTSSARDRGRACYDLRSFHIFNHLFGLISPESHAAVMDIGRTVYRAKFIEPLLVALMLFQIFSGLRLVWTLSESSTDRYRMFQLASGVFISVFILGHMNSVFIFARTWLNIPTDWAFATGAPTGLIRDAWNIRLVPHYALGVFFVLAHLASGLRVVMLAHGMRVSVANRIWWSGIVLSIAISAAIMCGMAGLRLV